MSRAVTGRGRRRIAFCAVAAAALTLLGDAATAQRPYPVYTAYHLDQTMTLVGRNFAGANASLASDDFETAKARLTRTREQLAVSTTFWRHNRKDDAIRMLRETLATLDALDAELSAEEIDPIAVGSLSKQATAACEACHAVYRERDEATKTYGLKLSSG